MLDTLHWLGLHWDEGPEVGGPYGPYRQSQRYEHLHRRGRQAARRPATPTTATARTDELDAAARGGAGGRQAQSATTVTAASLTAEQIAAYEAEGRSPCSACACRTIDVTFTDLVRGEITFEPADVPDYVIVRANGQPLYTLVNPVDDALMGITHVLRGEDLLSSHAAPDRV